MFRMFMDNLKSLTFTFFKLKVPNFKQFLWNIGTGRARVNQEAKAVLDNVMTNLSVCGVLK